MTTTVLLIRYALMLKCWEADVDERLSFEDITDELGKTTGKYCKDKTVI